MMEEPEHSEPKSPLPVRPQFLDYRGAVNPDRPRMKGEHIAVGFGCWLLSIGAAYGLGMGFQSGWAALFGWVAVLVACSIYFGGRLKWPGYVPGILIGAAMTCLVPAGILATLCWSR
jgi:4-hydroxybenzoate polyprenyltransferase